MCELQYVMIRWKGMKKGKVVLLPLPHGRITMVSSGYLTRYMAACFLVICGPRNIPVSISMLMISELCFYKNINVP